MKISEIFNQLTTGEFSQLSIGGAEAGEISPTNYGKILPSLNLGLTALYKRFPLKQGQITLDLVPGRLLYPLTRLYAQSNTRSPEAVKFIQDTLEPFQDDILKIDEIMTLAGYRLSMNDPSDEYTIVTPSLQTLRLPPALVAQGSDLPEELKTAQLIVVYRANHPQIIEDDFDIDDSEVELPYSHLEALLLFIASRFQTPLGMGQEGFAGNNYAAKYELACQQLEQQNILIDQGAQNTRLVRNGWV